jgi:hypothetical protein
MAVAIFFLIPITTTPYDDIYRERERVLFNIVAVKTSNFAFCQFIWQYRTTGV